jgi:hypothetical protein
MEANRIRIPLQVARLPSSLLFAGGDTMNLSNFNHLSASDKLELLRTTGGLTMLANALSDGYSLRQIAKMIGITPKTMYRWQATYPEIAAEITPYTQAAYRIIYAYDAYGKHFKGYVMEEFDTLDEVWSSGFIQQYFRSFGESEAAYQSAYLDAMVNIGFYRLSNLYLLTYCTVNKKGLIKPQKSIK